MLYFKNFLCLILIISFLFTLNGCTSRQSINDLAYVIALGLDVGENNNLKMSLQISKTNSSSKETGSSQSADSIINSVECSSIASGISLFNSYLGKEINLAHCKVIVISEELAAQGISEYIYTLVNNIQIHAEANMVICKCTAENFLNCSTPALESLSAKYYEIASSSSQYTGYTENITFGEFFADYTDTFQEAYAVLGGINTNVGQTTITTSNKISEYIDITNTDNTYVAGEVPTFSNNIIETLGLAVFQGDKLIVELNGIETISHMIITNKLNICNIRIPSPISIDEYLDINIRLASKPKIKVYLLNNTPYITIDVELNARLLSMSEDSNDLSAYNKSEIQQYINNYLKENLTNYLYTTSKELHSDIAGFGKYAVHNFLTWDEWVKYNWNHNYKNSFFNVNVTSHLRSAYLLIDS